MGKAQRTKGASFERDVVNALKDAGIDAARNLDQTRDGGGDIDLGAYMIECKRRASIAVYDWLDQCTRAARPGQIPLVVASMNYLRLQRGESVGVELRCST